MVKNCIGHIGSIPFLEVKKNVSFTVKNHKLTLPALHFTFDFYDEITMFVINWVH